MITGCKIRLRRKRVSDARDDYAWYSDPEVARMDAVPRQDMPFNIYLREYREALRRPAANRLRFAVETLAGEHIGNCACYHINMDSGEAEVGVMIGNREYWDRGYGADALNSLLNHLFRHHHLKRLYLKTLTDNVRARKCFEKCGFAAYGHLNRNGYRFILMEIHRHRWEAGHKPEPAARSSPATA